jgi:pilus assembly protein Flp/PilA
MANFLAFAKHFGDDESGQDLIEYALVAGLIGLAAVTAMGTLGNTIGNGFNTIGNTLSNALTPAS